MKKFLILIFLSCTVIQMPAEQINISITVANTPSKKDLIKKYFKIACYSIELTSGLMNFSVLAYMLYRSCSDECLFDDRSWGEQLFSFTKLGIFGPALTAGGLMGLYEEIQKLKHPQNNIVTTEKIRGAKNPSFNSSQKSL